MRLLWAHIDLPALRRLAMAITLSVLAAALHAVTPLALQALVDRLPRISSSAPTPLYWLLIAYVAGQWLARVLGEWKGVIFTAAEQRVCRRLSDHVFSHVMGLPLEYHIGRHTGAVSEAINAGVQGYQLALHHLAFTALPVVVELGTVAVILSGFEQLPFFALLAVTLLVYAALFSLGTARVMPPARAAAGARVQANAILTDALINCETVKHFTAESLIRTKYDGALARIEAHWRQFSERKGLNGAAIATVFAVSLAATLLYGLHEVERGAITVGVFVLMNLYAIQLVRPVESLGIAAQSLARSAASVERMLDLMANVSEGAADVHAARAAVPGRGTLVFEDVSFGYRPDQLVLNDISFVVHAGSTLGIVGASGAGKSSLTRLLLRLYEPVRGRILLDGTPISHIDRTALRRAIAVVPQDTVLLNDTLGANIALGREECTREEIEAAAKAAHLHDFITHLPQGYETRVGERGLKLSGGERQRVAIARAVLKRARIYILDEATSSLDSRTEAEIQRNLLELSDGRTTLVIAHRLSSVMRADHIIVLHDGSILEQGTHAALLRQGGRYSALWAAQQFEVSSEAPVRLAL